MYSRRSKIRRMPTAAGSLGVLAGVLLLTVAVAEPGAGVRAATSSECTTATPTLSLGEATTAAATLESSPSSSPSVSSGAVPSSTATPATTPTPTLTPSPVASSTATDTPTPTISTGTDPSSTATSAATATETMATATGTGTAIATPTPSSSPVASSTATGTPTQTMATAAETGTATPTATPSPGPATSSTATDTPTAKAAEPEHLLATASPTEERAAVAATTTDTPEATPTTETDCATGTATAGEPEASADATDGTSTPSTVTPSATGAAPIASATVSPTATLEAQLSAEVECQWVTSATTADVGSTPSPEPGWSDRCGWKAAAGTKKTIKANAGDSPGVLAVTVWTTVRNGFATTPIHQSVQRPDGTPVTVDVEFVEIACSLLADGSPHAKCVGDSRALYRSTLPISYRDRCGIYELETSVESAPAEKLSFESECFVAVDLDFTAISWGRIMPGAMSGVIGDLEWQPGGTGGPSVRNVGNAPMSLGIVFSPLSMAGDPAGASTALQEFRACLGTGPGEPHCAEAITAKETMWIGDTLGQAICPGQVARLDVFVIPPPTVPQGSYEGSLSLPARLGPPDACEPAPRS